MTKEQEEAIKFLELHTNFMGKLDKGRCIRIPEENFTKTKESIKTVLNMLKENSAEIHQKNTELAEKNAEIEKYKKLLADNLARNLNDSIKAKEKADTDLDDLNKGWQVELEKYKQLYNKALDDAVITAHDNMKKDKMIDLLVNKLNQNCKVFENSEIKEIVEIYEKIKSTSNLRGIEVRKECIKQYFERKVEDECKR